MSGIASMLAAAHAHATTMVDLAQKYERGELNPKEYADQSVAADEALTAAMKAAVMPLSDVPWSKSNNPCLAKAGDHEPLFVLRAQDFSAPEVVQKWIDVNGDRLGPVNPKLIDALNIRDAMAAWPNRKHPD